MVPCEKILQTARELDATVIGLSGLITPSLDEMVHVAREMERAGFRIPLLIGGATTSKAHTAVKIAPGYAQPVVHVLDASRAAPVVGSLLSAEQKGPFVSALRAEYDRLRAQYAGQAQRLIPLEQARRRAPRLDWAAYQPPRPEFLGLRVLSSDAAAPGSSHGPIALRDVVPFIDWSPFFHTWELRGRFPSILDHPKHGEEARRLFADAQQLLEQIVAENLLSARAVYGFFPAHTVGDDVELYSDDTRDSVLATFHFLRQQQQKDDGQPNWCLADFVAPKPPDAADAKTHARDYLGAFAVTTGFGLAELNERFRREHDDYHAILAEALADRLAEALAEYLHKRVRAEWGYGQQEALTAEQLIDEQYQGIRPAAGYPACPDHTEKRTLWHLLEVERHTGIKLTESCAMWPGSSVSGLYFSHPASKYFGVGKIDRDQVLDYHLRKRMTLHDVERWLGPYLNYDPSKLTTVQALSACGCGVPHAVNA
jgi:5-methyltetrahydrofolate--homocysteine methyltransferase